MKKVEKNKNQIRIMCRFNDIEFDEGFVDYVYNKFLPSYNGVVLKQLKKEYSK